MNPVPILFLIIVLLPGAAAGQLSLDSLLQVYEQQPADTGKVQTLSALYNATLYNDREAALAYARKELQLSRKLGFRKGQGEALYHIGAWHYNYNQFDSSLIFYEEAAAIFEELGMSERLTAVTHGKALLEYSKGNYEQALSYLDDNTDLYRTVVEDSVGLAITFDLKGVIQSFRGNYRLALSETLKAVHILEKADKPVRLADAFSHLGGIEFYLENYEQSIEYNQKALSIYQSMNDTYYMAQAYNDIGNTMYYVGRYEEAVKMLDQSIRLSEQMGVDELRATSLTNLGRTYLEMDLPDEAENILQTALSLAEELENTNKKIEARLALARLYLDTGRPLASLPHLDRAAAEADTIGVKVNELNAYLYRSEAYEKLGRTTEALEDYQRYAALKDSVLNEGKSRQIEEMRTLYETEKKEQQISLQENEIMILQQEARIDRMQKLILAGGLLLAMIVVYGIRQKLKRNKLEKKQVENELDFRQKELTTHALHLARKNAILEELKSEAELIKATESDNRGLHKLISTINADLRNDANWEQFSRYFEQVHANFNQRVKNKYPGLTSNELRLLALMKMNLSSKEIASILNISADGIKKARYRIRKKMDISSDDTLQDFVINL